MTVFQYSNYREYIKAKVDELRTANEFSFRKFSAGAGFSSPNFLKLVMDGKRNLSLEGARKVAKGLGLASKEADFFERLVMANQTRDPEMREDLTQGLLKTRAKNSDTSATVTDYDYYRYWYNVPVREALLVPLKQQSITKIAESFQPPLLPTQVKAALKILSDLKMIQKDNKGRWQVTQETLATNDFFVSSMIVSFHLKMLELAKESLTRFSGKEREVSAATISLSKESFEKVREIMKEAKEKALALSEADKNKQDVYQFNIQLFPLTKGLKDDE